MVAVSIKTNFPQVQKQLETLHTNIGERAMASAINSTLAIAKTAMGRAIVQEFNVSAAYVRDRLRLRRASAKRGSLNISGALIGGRADGKRSANVIAFVDKKVTLAASKRRRKAGTLNQVFVKIKRKGGSKPLDNVFIGNKGRTVFARVGKSRLPIRPVQTIDVSQMFNTQRINDAVVKVMYDRFPEIFARDARFWTDRFNGGAK